VEDRDLFKRREFVFHATEETINSYVK
jgi:hypothetical protein